MKQIFVIAMLMFTVLACSSGVASSGGPSEADIEATIQARIASIPTSTPQIVIQEVIKEVIKEAAHTPAPIPTPNITVTPIPTATAVPPTATPVSTTPESTPVSDLTNTSSEQNNMPDKYSFFHGCSGTGTVMFDQSPMYYEDFISIRPYGQISGAHVTPIDHMYFNPMDRSLGRDSYEVRAIADGVIHYMKPRDISVDSGKAKLREWRVDIAHTCSFHSYFDLLTSLSQDILDEWELSKGETSLGWNGISVKSGQLIGRIGGQTLDFGVYNYEIVLEGFVFPEHYASESWKIHTVDPFPYFNDEVRSVLLQKNLRKIEPYAGKIDYDIDGTLSGNWFEVDTNWFAGKDLHKYWDGHLSIVPNHIDPTAWMFAIGNWPDATSSSGAAEFKIVNAEPSPGNVGVEQGIVKYELSAYKYCAEPGSEIKVISHISGGGLNLTGCKKSIGLIIPDTQLLAKDTPSGDAGVILVQLIEPRLLKVEVFPDKMLSEVFGFTGDAKLYER